MSEITFISGSTSCCTEYLKISTRNCSFELNPAIVVAIFSLNTLAINSDISLPVHFILTRILAVKYKNLLIPENYFILRLYSIV